MNNTFAILLGKGGRDFHLEFLLLKTMILQWNEFDHNQAQKSTDHNLNHLMKIAVTGESLGNVS